MPSGALAASEAPPIEAFTRFPASWYPLCRSSELAGRPVSKTVLGRRLAAFRGPDGRPTVMAASCAHMGADLGKGSLVSGRLQCPFHGWEYGADGRCRLVPGSTEIPDFARQRAYPAEERHGTVFFFHGEHPLFPLPFFDGRQPSDYAALPFSFEADCPWYMTAAHGFDERHFLLVHGRRLIGLPDIDVPAPFARRNRYRAEVVGRAWYDRLLRRAAGRFIDMSITVWGGTFFVMEGDFGRLKTRFILALRPLEGGGTFVDGFVFTRRAAPLVDSLSLRARRTMTQAYLADEAASLKGTRYDPRTLVAADRELVEFFRWAAALPQARRGPQTEAVGRP
ncbi:MAG: Rieske 2Fe-2S domain-containing protein [Elusimicrobia bacterium]|nr:Rieske 2Fe-2S domain-containing protein [Elusimicrobiota bacterium]